MQFAVLTGDFVGSSDMPPAALDAAMAALRAGVTAAGSWPGIETAGFARRGGDGWQAALCPPAYGVRLALWLRALLRRDDLGLTRVALSEGDGTLPASGDPNAAHGPAFTASGRALEGLSGTVQMSHAAGGARQAACVLSDHISRGWTQAQARTLCELLPPRADTHAEAAARLGISRQAVDQAARAAGLPALLAALDAMERAT